jgi:hypothetical protein
VFPMPARERFFTVKEARHLAESILSLDTDAH